MQNLSQSRDREDWLDSTSRLTHTILPLAKLESETWLSLLPSTNRKAPVFHRRLADSLGQLELWIDFLDDLDQQALDNIPEHIERYILKFVVRLGETLCDFQVAALPEVHRLARSKINELKEYLEEKVKRLIYYDDTAPSDSSDDGSESESERSSGEVSSEHADELLSSLTETVSCLSQLLSTIERACLKSNRQDLTTHKKSLATFQLHSPAEYFIKLILDRFRNADSQLADRLGEANWQRRERVQLSISGVHAESANQIAEHLEIDQKTLFRPRSTFHDSALGSSVPTENPVSINDDDVASLFSVASSMTGTSARVPPTPKEVELGEPFECFICHHEIYDVHNRRQWKFHVFSDLQSYICCRDTCDDGTISFSSRREWSLHDQRKHSDTRLAHSDCLLCRKRIGSSGGEYDQHMGRHLESISLLALPAYHGEEDDDDDKDSSDGSESCGNNHLPKPADLIKAESTLTSESEDRSSFQRTLRQFHGAPTVELVIQGNGYSLDLFSLWKAVRACGTSFAFAEKASWTQVRNRLGSDTSLQSIPEDSLKNFYETWILPWELSIDFDVRINGARAPTRSQRPDSHILRGKRQVPLPKHADVVLLNTISPHLLGAAPAAGERALISDEEGANDTCDLRTVTNNEHANLVDATARAVIADQTSPAPNLSGTKTLQCHLCPKTFERAYSLRSHLRTHTDERPFVCTICGKAFTRQHDRNRHEALHSGEKNFVCKGSLQSATTSGQVVPDQTWGCGRRFARADALGRHFRSEAGRACIRLLLEEEARERQEAALMEQSFHKVSENFDFPLPAALLQEYPALRDLQ
ncbi:hypothetical protein FH972_023089 [Carpinus fangiana]|uniref:C2H2-type domain-containing protein n=1 Tax=Carpinus fangiana TaxID=176857 RepID=A0A5N6KUL1_9ROSI|nr:hypothetical protein FH972_023089 [Carpinus fangiana]